MQQPSSSGSTLMGLRSTSARTVAVSPGVFGEAIRGSGQGWDVERPRAPVPAQERRAADLVHHRLRLAGAERQHAQRHILQDLDRNPAEAKGEDEAKIQVAADAREHLDAARHHLLHQHARDAAVRRGGADALLQFLPAGAQRVGVADGDAERGRDRICAQCRPTPP